MTDSLLIRITPEVLEDMFTRDSRGNRLRVTIGEPTEYIYEDVSGDVLPVYTPTVTVDYTDTLLTLTGLTSIGVPSIGDQT